MANIPIGNNIIYMQKKGSADPKDTIETVLLGAERIDVGVNSGKSEIAVDSQSGFKYERNAVDSKTIYNQRTQTGIKPSYTDPSIMKHSCCFVLDLETGSRGWYPGAIQIADIIEDNVPIKAEKSDTSETLLTVSNVTVKVNDLEYDSSQYIWYKVTYNNVTGYVKNRYISNVRYSDPY